MTELTKEVESIIQRLGKPRPRRRNNRTLKKFTWGIEGANPSLMDNNKIFLGASDLNDFVLSQVLEGRIAKGLQTGHRELHVLANRKSWVLWMEQYFKDQLYTQTSKSSGFVQLPESSNFIKYYVSDNSTEIDIYGDKEFIAKIVNDVSKEFNVVTSTIEWMYGANGDSASVPLNESRLPLKEMYPFLGDESLESYYNRYMHSDASILLLIGPPGTGKTTFIRGLLSHTKMSAQVTYDAGILEKDYVFARFIEGDSNIMVLEDSDNFLKSRSDGNTMMHRFLNVGDGLVTTKGKKMIFSTNLPSIRDVDAALVRPGRCFDILHFDLLQYEHAKILANKLSVSLPVCSPGEEATYSVAEIFNGETFSVKNTPVSRSVGFI